MGCMGRLSSFMYGLSTLYQIDMQTCRGPLQRIAALQGPLPLPCEFGGVHGPLQGYTKKHLCIHTYMHICVCIYIYVDIYMYILYMYICLEIHTNLGRTVGSDPTLPQAQEQPPLDAIAAPQILRGELPSPRRCGERCSRLRPYI